MSYRDTCKKYVTGLHRQRMDLSLMSAVHNPRPSKDDLRAMLRDAVENTRAMQVSSKRSEARNDR